MSLSAGFEGVLAAAQEGADWAWELLIRELSGSLLGFFRVRGADDPDDLVGEVFHDVARGIGGFSGDEAGFRSWVFVIAHRRLVDARRRRGRSREEPQPLDRFEGAHLAPSAEATAMDGFGADHVYRLLARLTPDQRDVLALRVVAGLSLEETARVVGKRVGAVKALQRRALAAVRREMKKKGVSR